MKTFNLPDLGEGLHEATIVEWYAQANDVLKQGERLLAVETAKAIVEIPAPEDLIINELLVAINTVVKVGSSLFSYTLPNIISANIAPVTASVSVVGSLIEASDSHSERPFIYAHQRFNADELARSQHALETKSRAQTLEPPAKTHAQELLLSGVRLTMSQQLSYAHQQVALVTLFDEVKVNWPKKTRPMPRFIRALCAGCQAEPKLNAWFDDGKLILHSAVNIGIATNTAYGLMVPVLTNAHQLTFNDMIIALKKLKDDALTQRLTPALLQGATISLSNFGMMAGRFATPMVVPPQVAILGVGRIDSEYMLNKKHTVKHQQSIPLSLSFDHRVLTGGEAANFLAAVITNLRLKK